MEQRDALSQCPLFAKIEANLLDSLLDCLTAVKRVYRKDEFVFRAGDKATRRPRSALSCPAESAYCRRISGVTE